MIRKVFCDKVNYHRRLLCIKLLNFRSESMKLRKLQLKDAQLMLEWMHDDSVVHYLSTNFASKTIEDCEAFILQNQECNTDMNLAITDDSDEYMGTVSLKHIDYEKGTAEFAVTIRKCAMGKGYSSWGMAEILKKGIEELGLNNIYWCVSRINERAVRFYDKNQYQRTEYVPENIKNFYTNEQNELFIWYVYS